MSNHAAFIKQCPQATYNMHNSPYLIPAFVLDRIFYHATVDITKGVYESQGILRHKLEEHNMDALRHILRHQEIPKYKLEEFFVADVAKTLARVKRTGQEALLKRENDATMLAFDRERCETLWKELKLVPDPKWRRLEHTLDMALVEEIIREELKQTSTNALKQVFLILI